MINECLKFICTTYYLSLLIINHYFTFVFTEVDDVILEFAINSKSRTSTITFGGHTNPIQRKLSAETNVRMFIPGPDSHTSKATLEGTFDNVKRYVNVNV